MHKSTGAQPTCPHAARTHTCLSQPHTDVSTCQLPDTIKHLLPARSMVQSGGRCQQPPSCMAERTPSSSPSSLSHMQPPCIRVMPRVGGITHPVHATHMRPGGTHSCARSTQKQDCPSETHRHPLWHTRPSSTSSVHVPPSALQSSSQFCASIGQMAGMRYTASVEGRRAQAIAAGQGQAWRQPACT